MANSYKQYTAQAKQGIKGEAFFESLVSEHALPHRIVGPKDVGIDYLCEWVYGDKPTGILWTAQVKTASKQSARPKFLHTDVDFNKLDVYEIKGTGSRVDERTLRYWQGLNLPTYLFVVVCRTRNGHQDLDCYYKRFTPVLTGTHRQEGLSFYKVNKGHSFIAFAVEENKTHGFARDLFVDYMRWNYYKGSIAWLPPSRIGLQQFGDNPGTVFGDLIESYRDQVCSTYARVKPYLDKLCNHRGT